MSEGMLGNLPLSAVRGPREDLENKLAGMEGETWLTELKKFLRREPTWVSREATPAEPAPKPTFVGTVVKTLRLNPYWERSVMNAIKAGQYDNDTAEIIRYFSEDEVGLASAASVELVQFDGDPWRDDMIAWAAENHKKPILSKHLFGIGTQYPDEQCKASIVELGSVRFGDVLILGGNSACRRLDRRTVRCVWSRQNLFGFVSEPA